MENQCSKALIQDFNHIKERKISLESSYLPAAVKNIVYQQISSESSSFAFGFESFEYLDDKDDDEDHKNEDVHKKKKKRKKKKKKQSNDGSEELSVLVPVAENEDQDPNAAELETKTMEALGVNITCHSSFSFNFSEPQGESFDPGAQRDAQATDGAVSTSIAVEDTAAAAITVTSPSSNIAGNDINKLDSSKKKQQQKKKKGKKDYNPAKTQLQSKEDQDFDKAIEEARAELQASSVSHIKATPPSSHTHHKDGLDKHNFRFLSPNDPEITQEQREKLKYGQAKNLVAIGPPRVRDSHWIDHHQPQQPTTIAAPVAESVSHVSPFTFGFDSFSQELKKLKI
jgi:hypothetical protein